MSVWTLSANCVKKIAGQERFGHRWTYAKFDFLLWFKSWQFSVVGLTVSIGKYLCLCARAVSSNTFHLQFRYWSKKKCYLKMFWCLSTDSFESRANFNSDAISIGISCNTFRKVLQMANKHTLWIRDKRNTRNRRKAHIQFNIVSFHKREIISCPFDRATYIYTMYEYWLSHSPLKQFSKERRAHER